MSIRRNITAADDKFFLGEDKVLRGIVYQADGVTPQDITAWEIWFVLDKTDTANPLPSSSPLIEKKTTDPGPNNIVITDASQGEYEIRFVDTDTDREVVHLRPFVEYWYSVKRMDDGSENVFTDGTFEFAGATQR